MAIDLIGPSNRFIMVFFSSKLFRSQIVICPFAYPQIRYPAFLLIVMHSTRTKSISRPLLNTRTSLFIKLNDISRALLVPITMNDSWNTWLQTDPYSKGCYKPVFLRIGEVQVDEPQLLAVEVLEDLQLRIFELH
jgi:hypothetical protein